MRVGQVKPSLKAVVLQLKSHPLSDLAQEIPRRGSSNLSQSVVTKLTRLAARLKMVFKRMTMQKNTSNCVVPVKCPQDSAAISSKLCI